MAGEKRTPFRDVDEAKPHDGVRWKAIDLNVAIGYRSCGRPRKARNRTQERAFSGSVRADESHELPLIGDDVDTIESCDFAVADVKILYLKHRLDLLCQLHVRVLYPRISLSQHDFALTHDDGIVGHERLADAVERNIAARPYEGGRSEHFGNLVGISCRAGLSMACARNRSDSNAVASCLPAGLPKSFS